MSENDLQKTARHEAGHVVACWHFSGRIIGTTLGGEDALSGSVWGQYNTGTLVGQRQAMVGMAAGSAATGDETEGDDAKRLEEAARRIVGMLATHAELAEEIAAAVAAARWLTDAYREEIESTARLLVQFHEHLAGMERRWNDAIL